MSIDRPNSSSHLAEFGQNGHLTHTPQNGHSGQIGQSGQNQTNRTNKLLVKAVRPKVSKVGNSVCAV